MRNTRNPASPTKFLGVRLTEEEVELLDRFRAAHDLSNTSEAVRRLVRSIAQPAGDVQLPASLRSELEDVVEDGWATDINGAVSTALNLGLRELTRLHADEIPTLRDAARSHAARRADRKRAEREGRGLLRR